MLPSLKLDWRPISLGVLVSMFVFYLLLQVAERRVANILNVLTAEQEMLQTTASELALQLRRGQFPETALTRYIPCALIEQTKFDELLGKLSNSLTNAELGELQVLFQKCAYSNVYQRLFTTLQLENAIAHKESLKTAEARHRFIVTNQDVNEQLSEFVKNEQVIAEIAMNLVRLQGIIIAELSIGTAVRSEAIVSVLEQVDAAKNEMSQLRLVNEGLRPGLGL